MKEKTKGLITGVIIGTIVTGTAGAFAAYYTATENPYPVTYNGVKADMEGYNVNDSTYFKLRDIADIVGGFDVDFKDNKILLTSNANSKPLKTYEYIKDIAISKTYGDSDNSRVYADGNTIKLDLPTRPANYPTLEEGDECKVGAEFNLNGEFRRLTGNIYSRGDSSLKFYCDGELVYTPMAGASSEIDIDISGCKTLKIEGVSTVGDRYVGSNVLGIEEAKLVR